MSVKKCARIDINGFLPLPDGFTKALNWKEGDTIEVEIIPDQGLILTKTNPRYPVQRKEDS